MGMLARNCVAEINVICLVGERGREVNDFIEESLGEEGVKKSVVIMRYVRYSTINSCQMCNGWNSC